MDIQEFIQQSEGKWFAQRTVYKLSEAEPDNSKAEVTLEILPFDHPAVIELCQKHHIEVTDKTIGIQSSWDNSVDFDKSSKEVGSSVAVLIPDLDQPKQGKLLQQSPLNSKVPGIGQCILAEDEALVLRIKGEEVSFEERLWFAGDNLRLRTTVLTYPDGIAQTSFYSEIRKIPPRPE